MKFLKPLVSATLAVAASSSFAVAQRYDFSLFSEVSSSFIGTGYVNFDRVEGGTPIYNVRALAFTSYFVINKELQFEGGVPIVTVRFPASYSIRVGEGNAGLLTQFWNIENNRYTWDITVCCLPGNPIPDRHDFGQLVFATAAPIPEPETYALMALGFGYVAWASRRRREHRGS